MTKTIAVSTNKGGVLKTSLTTNLAGVLARQDKKVLIIDVDNQGNSSIAFGINPDTYDTSIYDVFVDKDVSFEEAIVTASDNIDIAISNDDMTFLEYEVFTNSNLYTNIFDFLQDKLTKKVKNNYDYIFIDTPPNLGLATSNALRIADSLLIPFQPETYSLRSLVKTLNFYNDFKERHNPSLEVEAIVPTLVDARTTLHSQLLQDCRKYAAQNDLYVTDNVIPRSIRFSNSVAYGDGPATLKEKLNKTVNSYFKLIEELNY
ncbi:ParA family protein [Halobacillus locisalis]|uniref:ParA family protein n=1 Tax=Halobacillus locisalis TaxID=220753 RepID=A0A838CY60_9BACI|nr:ParA family protein [Halobacillus locisalis]